MSSNTRDAAGGEHCPHCGGELDRSLPQHMAHGLCQKHTSPGVAAIRDAEPEPDPSGVPVLEEAPETVEFDEEDRRRRQQLAEEVGDW